MIGVLERGARKGGILKQGEGRNIKYISALLKHSRARQCKIIATQSNTTKTKQCHKTTKQNTKPQTQKNKTKHKKQKRHKLCAIRLRWSRDRDQAECNLRKYFAARATAAPALASYVSRLAVAFVRDGRACGCGECVIVARPSVHMPCKPHVIRQRSPPSFCANAPHYDCADLVIVVMRVVKLLCKPSANNPRLRLRCSCDRGSAECTLCISTSRLLSSCRARLQPSCAHGRVESKLEVKLSRI